MTTTTTRPWPKLAKRALARVLFWTRPGQARSDRQPRAGVVRGNVGARWVVDWWFGVCTRGRAGACVRRCPRWRFGSATRCCLPGAPRAGVEMGRRGEHGASKFLFLSSRASRCRCRLGALAVLCHMPRSSSLSRLFYGRGMPAWCSRGGGRAKSLGALAALRYVSEFPDAPGGPKVD
jgi:hypothetical protein